MNVHGFRYYTNQHNDMCIPCCMNVVMHASTNDCIPCYAYLLACVVLQIVSTALTGGTVKRNAGIARTADHVTSRTVTARLAASRGTRLMCAKRISVRQLCCSMLAYYLILAYSLISNSLQFTVVIGNGKC